MHSYLYKKNILNHFIQKGDYMKKLIKLGGILLAAMASINVNAAGTAAGTSISNQASVSYDVGAGTASVSSNTVNIEVQELINATIIKQDSGDIAVSDGETGVVLKYQIDNIGNGSESFKIVPSNNASGDDFNVSIGKTYLDDGDGIFNSLTDIELTTNETGDIAADDNITVWVVVDIPSGLSDADYSEIFVAVQSTTFLNAPSPSSSPSQGDVVTGAGTSSTAAIFGANGNISTTSKLVVSTLNITIVKTVDSVNDNIDGSTEQYIPGADVTYKMVVEVSGNGTATGVVFTDQLESELRLYAGASGSEVSVNGVSTIVISPYSTTDAVTAAATGGNVATYSISSNEVIVYLGDITAPATRIILFTTTIQ